MRARERATKQCAGLAAVAVVLLIAAGCQQAQPVDDTPPAPPTLTIWEAAMAGDLAELAAHGAHGTNVNALDPELGVTALSSATAVGQAAAVDWLLANGADVNARAGDGNTALHVAAFVGTAEIAGKLLDAGIDVGATNDDGQTVWQTLGLDWQTTKYIADMLQLPLDQATVEAGRAALGELLEPHLAALGAEDIWLAVASGNADAVKSHVEAGADLEQRDDTGATMLTVAALLGYGDVTALLLEAGADVNARNYGNGATALLAASFLGQVEVVEMLLAAGADPTMMSDDGGTPLTVAQLDWTTTQYVAGMLQVPLSDEAAVMAGKAAVADLLRAALP